MSQTRQHEKLVHRRGHGRRNNQSSVLQVHSLVLSRHKKAVFVQISVSIVVECSKGSCIKTISVSKEAKRGIRSPQAAASLWSQMWSHCLLMKGKVWADSLWDVGKDEVKKDKLDRWSKEENTVLLNNSKCGINAPPHTLFTRLLFFFLYVRQRLPSPIVAFNPKETRVCCVDCFMVVVVLRLRSSLLTTAVI